MTDELPEGWVEANLFDLCSPKQWKTISTKELTPQGYPVFGANGQIGFFSEYNHEQPTVLITCRGATCGTINVCYPYSYVTGNSMALDDVDERLLDLRFLVHALNNRGLDDTISGSAQPQITRSNLECVAIPLPPLPEQLRIVEKVEALLADVSAARDRLSKVVPILKRFRQSVLAAACSGRLTEEWRDEHLSKSCEARLADLAQERELLWQKVIAQRTGNENGRVRYRPGLATSPPDDADVPPTWEWASVSQLALLDVGFAFRSADFTDEGVPLLRGENVEPGALRWAETRCWPKDRLRGVEHLLVEEGDLILAMDRPIISSGLKLARAAKSDVPCLLVQRVMRIRCVEPETVRWLQWCLLEARFANFLGHEGMTGSDLPHITGTGVAEFAVPLPPTKEQAEIVRRVESLFSLADAIEARVKAATAKAEKIPQAILSKAFKGELVPTEAELALAEGRTYETAAEMLARVKAGEPIAKAGKKPRGRAAKGKA